MGYHMILAENCKNLMKNHMVPPMNILKIHQIFLKNSYGTPYEFFQSFENFVENSYGTPYDFS